MVRRSAWYTVFGSRACCTSSLNTRLPNRPVDPLAPFVPVARVSFDSATDQLRMAAIASPRTAEPMTSFSLLLIAEFQYERTGIMYRFFGPAQQESGLLKRTEMSPTDIFASKM